MSIPVIAVIGPTAVGKTALSVELAKKLDGEVISVDSRQVYRYMDVGTDKIDRETRKDVLHHLIDVVDPDEIFSVADFIEMADKAVDRIISRGKVPVFAGGTPFYYRALFDRSLTVNVPSNREIRQELDSMDPFDRFDYLAEVDPETARRLSPNDSVRVIRALEVYRVSGKPISSFRKKSASDKKERYSPLYIGLLRPREDLCLSIEKRVRQQFYGGYPEEVQWLLDKGFSPELPSMKGFGYRELVLYCQGKMSLEEGIESDIIATRQFAKRQMTWFKKFFPVNWYDLSKTSYNGVLSETFELSVAHVEEGDNS
ncbi:tRNA (adenosine(37)-N6)-dimethylallyltransferase MiaA [Dethiosulfovibrio salsuginis]|uniref:tRNA dimethylallyltransferase n=1 Tax=Dethiosulfovibrio salsuginis TaxID=561720 RepID=A0A1X7I1W5_9BACT|nr:tRNA (adenosine(37)-N6)-dimethylallyltransferase MiaA [Dethiosulfovibrio salsuginis]SMG08397.1 tRNA dimethylallyltransferase [Dethiosulfovibrio salsuginis]